MPWMMPTRIRIASWALTLAMSGPVICAWAQKTPAPDDPGAVVAETQQNSKRQGMVRVAGLTWKCSNRLCIATLRNARVSVNTCQALAEQVGSLSRFGRVSRPIPSYDLALCNVRAQIKLAKIEQQRAERESAGAHRAPVRGAAKPAPFPPPVAAAPPGKPVTPPGAAVTPLASQSLPVAPAAPVVRHDAPPVVEASPIAPTYRPSIYAIRVMPLAVVGRGTARFEPAPAPAAEEPPASAAAPVPLRYDVPPLALVGHGRLREAPQGTHLTITVDKLELVGKAEGTQ